MAETKSGLDGVEAIDGFSVQISTLSLPVREMFLADAEATSLFTAAVGADAIQLQPPRGSRLMHELNGYARNHAAVLDGELPTMSCWPLVLGTIITGSMLQRAPGAATIEAVGKLVGSEHASFHPPDGVNTPIDYLFPKWDDSIMRFGRLNRMIGARTLVSFSRFDNIGLLGRMSGDVLLRDRFSRIMVQPTPEDFLEGGLGLPPNLPAGLVVSRLAERGFDKDRPIAEDSIKGELDGPNGQRFTSSREVFGSLAKANADGEFHVAVGRTDEVNTPDAERTTMSDFRAFAGRSSRVAASSFTGERLAAVRDATRTKPLGPDEPPINVVIELGPRVPHTREVLTNVVANTRAILTAA